MFFEHIARSNFNHKAVVSFYDKKTQLKGFIAIYNTNIGPAFGGTRFYEYKKEENALDDALRLSRGMAYKCALAGIKGGGGKGVIIKDKNTHKTKEFFKKYAEVINIFNGNFYTGEDIGMNSKDITLLRKQSKFILGTVASCPAYWTAVGVFNSIKAVLKYYFSSSEISKYSFAIKGVGKVGSYLLDLLYKEGGRIFVADINPLVIKDISKRYKNVKIVSPDVIHKLKVDVYAPCAIGGEFNDKSIKEINCKIICGGANNQLVNDSLGGKIFKKGIIYIPDYLVNSGGLISVTEELNARGYSEKRVAQKVYKIAKRVLEVLQLSEKLKKPTNFIANELAESVINIK